MICVFKAVHLFIYYFRSNLAKVQIFFANLNYEAIDEVKAYTVLYHSCCNSLFLFTDTQLSTTQGSNVSCL